MDCAPWVRCSLAGAFSAQSDAKKNKPHLLVLAPPLVGHKRMKTARLLIMCLSLLFTAQYIQGQGTFQNLGFESASIPPSPGTFIPFTNALPGWTGLLGTNSATQALYYGTSLSFAEVSIEARNAQ